MMDPRPTDYARAEALLRKAIALDPNVSGARNWLANILSEQGRRADATAVQEQALLYDPLAPSINANIAMAYAAMGEFERAEQRLLRMLELPQPSYVAHVTLMEIYNDTGRLVDANDLAKWRVMQWVESSGSAWANWLFWNYAELGMWEAAEYWYDRNENESPEWVNYARRERTELLVRQGRFAEAVKSLEFVIESAGGDLENLNYRVVSDYGAMQSMAGDYEDAIETLEPAPDTTTFNRADLGDSNLWDGFHGLAWAYIQTGTKNKALPILDAFDEEFRKAQSEGRLHRSSELMMYARNTLLAGDEDLALDRFRQAVDVGWRDYYQALHDPRWDSVRGRPDFQELMATVKADVDVQRAQVEQIDAEKDFAAKVDQAIAARETTPRPVTN